MAQITITIPDELLVTHQRVQQDLGASWADEFITEKLSKAASQYSNDDAVAMFAKFQALSSSDQATVTSELERKVVAP